VQIFAGCLLSDIFPVNTNMCSARAEHMSSPGFGTFQNEHAGIADYIVKPPLPLLLCKHHYMDCC
jgi:hypothetical protein